MHKRIAMFKFKKFTIEQENCAMKVGTDGCLLGAWADIKECKKIMDIGTGSGLLAIMAAQRSNALITAVEIDKEAALQAQKNVNNSPWSDRIEIINCDIADYTSPTEYDAIISNPPYFVNSLKCPDKTRSIARHNDTLPPCTMMAKAKEFLIDGGTLSVVLPADALEKWCDEALFKGLSTRRMTFIHTLPHKPAKRVLIEFVKGVCIRPQTSEFILEESPGRYSNEAIELLKDFYIKIN